MTTSVFLSYGRGDDDPDFYDPAKSFMRRLYDGLKAAGFEVWWDRESLPSRALTFLEEIRNAIDSCDKLVLVVGEYSMRPGDNYVRPEWEHALNTCKNIIPILRNGDYKLIPPEIALANAPDFRDGSLFDHKLAELVRLLSQKTAAMGDLYSVSELPRGYIERKADMQAVSALIRSEAVKPTVVTATQGRAAAVYGLGGIGKTVLTRALCHDCNLRRSFPDGIIWLEIGKTPLITARQADIGEIFGDSRDKYIDEQTGKSRLSQILRDKRALIILDDIWEQEHVEPFRIFAQGCRLLMSTRNHRLANLLGANNYELDKLSEDQGIQLIAARFGKKPGEIAEAETLREIVRLLDGHTLAISIAATQLQEQNLEFAPRLLERMQGRLESKNPFKDLELEETDKNLNLELSLSLSYDDLKSDLQRRFRALGVLSPDGNFDTKLAAAIWNDTEATFDDTEDALNILIQKGLLIREESRFSQHNLLRAYTRALLTRAGELEAYFDRYADWVIELSEGFDEFPPEHWHTFELESPHILYIGDMLQECYSANNHPAPELEDRAFRFILNARIYLARRREIRRIEWLDVGLAIVRQRTDKKHEALFLNDLGMAWDTLGEKRKALDYLEQALPLRQAVGDWSGQATTLNNIGMTLNTLGEHGKALGYLSQALELWTTSDDQTGKATALNNIGLIYDDLGEKRKALNYYEQALPLIHAIGNWSGEATTLNNIGMIYTALEEHHKALDYHEQALPLIRAVGDQHILAHTLNNIGVVYTKLAEKRKALDYYEQAMTIWQVVGDQRGQVATLNNMASIYLLEGQITQAADIFEQIIWTIQTIGDVAGEAAFRVNRAVILYRLNNINQAISEIEHSVAILKRYNLPQDAAGQTLGQYRAGLAILRAIKGVEMTQNGLKGFWRRLRGQK